MSTKRAFPRYSTYINTGNFGGADQRFSSATKMKPDYGFQIGGEYKKAGMEALDKNNFSGAKNLFAKAISYQPDLKNKIAEYCIEKGTALLNKGIAQNTDSSTVEPEYIGAKEYFLTAKACDAQYGPKGAAEMLNAAKNMDDAFGQAKLIFIALYIDQSAHEEAIPLARSALLKAKKSRNDKTIKSVQAVLKNLHPDDYVQIYSAVYPPKVWTTVWSKPFIGVGKTGGDDKKYNDGGIWSIKHGVNLVSGDRYTVNETDVEVWAAGRWEPMTPGKWVYPEKIKSGGFETFRAPKGKNFKPIVQRLLDPI